MNSFQLIFLNWILSAGGRNQEYPSRRETSVRNHCLDIFLCDLLLFSFSFKFLLCCYLHTTVLHWIRSAIWWKWMGPLCWREMVFLLDTVWRSHWLNFINLDWSALFYRLSSLWRLRIQIIVTITSFLTENALMFAQWVYSVVHFFISFTVS